MSCRFEVLNISTASRARRGRLRTLNAEVETPAFMPVGTHGAVRGQRIENLHALGYRMLLANTYHLIIRPGIEHFLKYGDLRSFASWPHGFLTDSGGFQIFSLSKSRTITDDAAIFRSHTDGRRIHLTPELSVQAQRAFGSDIMMVLDECVPSTSSFEESRAAVIRSAAWARRSLEAREDSPQGLFAIVQGALFPELRTESASSIIDLPFDGFAIGGLAVGEGKEDRERMTEHVTALLPCEKPRYLMGVGTPLDVLEAVHRGVDLFDCVLPTLLGQQGVACTETGRVDLRRAEFRESKDPISQACPCPACRHYTRGYLHHLCKTYDSLVESLVGLHNLTFYQWLMEQIRTALKLGTFPALYGRLRQTLGGDKEENPAHIVDGKRYEVVRRRFDDGVRFSSVRHKASGEFMHSSEDPWRESNKLYVEQARLSERFEGGPLTIWDVGLGAATNAMGAVKCVEALGGTSTRLHLHSFENDLEPLTLALAEVEHFHHLNHGGPPLIQAKHAWSSPLVDWKLYYGDFAERLYEAPLPDVVFFDPFSYKVDSPLWTYTFFEKLFTVINNRPCVCFTFSASTAVRSALLAAGFFVARGAPTGKKKETTIFMTPDAARSERYELLGQRWMERWSKSHARYPSDVTGITSWFDEKIHTHPQFAL